MQVTLIGYGEVGRILAEDLRARGVAVAAFDIQLAAAASPTSDSMRRHARQHRVVLADSHVAAVHDADLVISAVTASQAVAVAQACAPGLARGSFFLDVNSASPGAKIHGAESVKAAGARYVEGAAMTALPPHRIKVPLLLGGPDAAALLPILGDLGFAARVASERLGVASATKMCRSVMIKGLEAMVIESFTTARHYGVEDVVIASLQETFPGIDWDRQGAYFFQRVIEHGRRRSEEAREVAVTVSEAGLQPWSATGTAERQAWMADLADAGWFGTRGGAAFARSADWRIEADRILAQVKKDD
jgi:3-hydroxyisobutyrate dehydrogenase-like beta-hydroxyacid dehydrogenase